MSVGQAGVKKKTLARPSVAKVGEGSQAIAHPTYPIPIGSSGSAKPPELG